MSTQGKKDRFSAAILAFLFGGIGVHYFYLGRTRAGLICLLFSWTFIPMILGVLTSLSYLSYSEERWTKEFCGQGQIEQINFETHKKCPDCAEAIKIEAKKCKHCGSELKAA